MNPGRSVGRGAALVFGLLILLGYFAWIGAQHAEGYEALRAGEDPYLIDYTPFYAASLQIRREPAEALYDARRRYWSMVSVIKEAFDGPLTRRQLHSAGLPTWMHPPTFILVVAPLASLPYLTSFVAWLVVTGGLYVAAIRAIVPDHPARVLALASPPTLFNMIYGQTGFLSGGLIGLGLSQLAARPVLAGVCIGLASVKPHFGVLIPLALLLGRHWRPFAAAAATVSGVVAVSLLAFGAAPWAAFFNALDQYVGGFGEGRYALTAMCNTVASLVLAGMSVKTAWAGQAVAMALAAGAVAWAWWGRRPAAHLGLQSAVLCLATLLFVPMVYIYDLVLLVPALAWLWMDMRGRGSARWERIVLLAGFVAPLPLWGVAEILDVQLFPVLLAALLGLAATRLYALRRTGSAGSSVAAAP